MAIIQNDFFSRSLARVTGFYMVLPNDMIPEMVGENEHYKRATKTLYLLHGYSGNNRDWLLGSLVQQLSAKYNLAIVMPSGDNSFYLDGKGTGKAYCQYTGKELVEYVRKTYGLSDQREDTLVGGLSMGGFGAIHTGLYFPDTFSKVIALSSALIIHNIENMQEDTKDGVADYDYYTSVFGELSKLGDSVNNPEYLVRALKQEGKSMPSIYMACGSEDFLIEPNRAFHKFLQEEQVDVTYTESPGVHDWSFWNQYLEPGIEWALS